MQCQLFFFFAHLLYGFGLKITNDVKVCGILPEYVYFFFSVWSWVDLLMCSVLPWLCLTISNSLLVWELNVSVHEAGDSLGPGQADRITDRKNKTTSITVTLIAVSAAFIILTFPLSCVQIFTFINWVNGSLRPIVSLRPFYYAQQLSIPLWFINSCINFYIYIYIFKYDLSKSLNIQLNTCLVSLLNFEPVYIYIYCLTGSKFRRETKQVFSCIFKDLDKSGGSTTVSTLPSNGETRFS